MNILWTYTATHHPELQYIPDLKYTLPTNTNNNSNTNNTNNTIVETTDAIGSYVIGGLLGEGQFASVRCCWKKVKGLTTPAEYEEQLQTPGQTRSPLLALKIINKDRIISFSMLRRLSTEIYTLTHLRSKYIITLTDVIQTEDKLYIITEKGRDIL